MSKTGKISYQQKSKIKLAKHREQEAVPGKLAYRIRRQLEEEGTKEVMEYKKHAN